MTMGYYRKDGSLNDDFYVDESGQRWFCTGDVGEVHSDCCLQIVGMWPYRGSRMCWTPQHSVRQSLADLHIASKLVMGGGSTFNTEYG